MVTFICDIATSYIWPQGNKHSCGSHMDNTLTRTPGPVIFSSPSKCTIIPQCLMPKASWALFMLPFATRLRWPEEHQNLSFLNWPSSKSHDQAATSLVLPLIKTKSLPLGTCLKGSIIHRGTKLYQVQINAATGTSKPMTISVTRPGKQCHNH